MQLLPQCKVKNLQNKLEKSFNEREVVPNGFLKLIFRIKRFYPKCGARSITEGNTDFINIKAQLNV
jgi:hypothetical protein